MPDPLTVIGDTQATDYTVSIDVVSLSLNASGGDYVQLCGRLLGNGTLWNFKAAPPPAVCLVVLANTSSSLFTWQLRIGAQTKETGSISASEKFQLAISFSGQKIAATVNGKQVTSLSDSTFAYGLAAVGSGWHDAYFDNFAIEL